MAKCLKPICCSDSKILILGSLPSIKSIEKNEYYGNPQNQFWKLISYVFEKKEIEFNSYDEKLLFLQKHSIALWDVIKYAERNGSLDSNIKKESYNDLYGFIKEYNIKKVFVNGGKAEISLIKYMNINNVSIEYKKLPSSSSANTKFSLDEKKIIWKEIINEISN